MKDEALRVKLQSVAFDGPAVQPLVPLRGFVLCVHAKSAACRRQGGRKSLLPRPAIVRLAVPAASRANRSWPKQAERCERARVALDEAEVEKVTGFWLDVREAEVLRFRRLQTPGLHRPLLGSLRGPDSGCCQLPGSGRLVTARRISWPGNHNRQLLERIRMLCLESDVTVVGQVVVERE